MVMALSLFIIVIIHLPESFQSCPGQQSEGALGLNFQRDIDGVQLPSCIPAQLQTFLPTADASSMIFQRLLHMHEMHALRRRLRWVSSCVQRWIRLEGHLQLAACRIKA